MLIIGVTGQPLSGKDTVGHYLETKGFTHFSGGDFIRGEMRERGLSIERAAVNQFSIQQRKEVGVDYPAAQIAEKISNNSVVSGIRNRSGAEVYQKRFGKNFILISVEAPLETRYKRGQGRGRIGDDISLEQFKEEEEKERSGSSFHEVDAVIEMADCHIVNDGAEEDLYPKIDKILKVELS